MNTETITLDTVLDYAAEVMDTPAKARRRDNFMSAAHAAGQTACEVCGRALVAGHEPVNGLPIGPTCHKRLLKWI